MLSGVDFIRTEHVIPQFIGRYTDPLKEGDQIELRAADDRALEITQTGTRDEALARLRSFRGLMPAGFRFDRSDANTR